MRPMSQSRQFYECVEGMINHRRRVGFSTSREIDDTMAALLGMPYDRRVNHSCIGRDRADLVLPGCAIFEAIRREWPTDRVRVADRGLREGILISLIDADRARRGGARGR